VWPHTDWRAQLSWDRRWRSKYAAYERHDNGSTGEHQVMKIADDTKPLVRAWVSLPDGGSGSC
jgi:hypothetical protein